MKTIIATWTTTQVTMQIQNVAVKSELHPFTLETVVRFDPWQNTKLEGLYAT